MGTREYKQSDRGCIFYLFIRKEGNVLFNDTLNTFYLLTYVQLIVFVLQLVPDEQHEDSLGVWGQTPHHVTERAEGEGPGLLDEEGVLVRRFGRVRGEGRRVGPHPVEPTASRLVPNCRQFYFFY